MKARRDEDPVPERSSDVIPPSLRAILEARQAAAPSPRRPCGHPYIENVIKIHESRQLQERHAKSLEDLNKRPIPRPPAGRPPALHELKGALR